MQANNNVTCLKNSLIYCVMVSNNGLERCNRTGDNYYICSCRFGSKKLLYKHSALVISYELRRPLTKNVEELPPWPEKNLVVRSKLDVKIDFL